MYFVSARPYMGDQRTILYRKGDHEFPVLHLARGREGLPDTVAAVIAGNIASALNGRSAALKCMVDGVALRYIRHDSATELSLRHGRGHADCVSGLLHLDSACPPAQAAEIGAALMAGKALANAIGFVTMNPPQVRPAAELAMR